MKKLTDFRSRFRILKGGKISLVVSALVSSVTLSYAAPSGGVVTSGSATISQNGNITNIQQATQKATINWQNFSIANNETVNFKQPNINSITLNRVIGNERSIINGALNANGQVWILNSNGVLFGKNASINTAGILATTSKLSDEDFNKGIYNFKDATNNSIINQGTIEVVNNGSVVLASKEVINEGTIKAIKGNVQLVGAKDYSINLSGNSLVNLRVNKGVLDAMVKNSGTIINNGGDIYLTTNAVDELLKGVVNNEGLIEANSIDDLTSHVELFAHGGKAEISGIINAKDGFVETSGKSVKIDDSFRVTANEWLIDPTDFTIAASGGDMSGTTLSTNLQSNNIVRIKSENGSSGSAGNIYVNDAISWDSESILLLNAQNDIFINKSITSTHTGGTLWLYYGQGSLNSGNTSNYYVRDKINLQAGDNFATKLGSDGPEVTWQVITELGSEGSTTGTDLQGINGDFTRNYVLGADIDASATSTWNSGKGFTPIADDGGQISSFSGDFDGLGHSINNLFIKDVSMAGLFESTSNSTIRNVSVTNANIAGTFRAGALVAFAENNTKIENVFTSGSVSNSREGGTGGIVGHLVSGSLENSYSTVEATSTNDNVGGLVGKNEGTIKNSYFNGTVEGGTYTETVNYPDNIQDPGLPCNESPNSCGGTSNVTKNYSNVGGLVGTNSGTVIDSFYNSTKESQGNSSYARTEIQLQGTSIYSSWDKNVWGFANDIEGYGVGVMPFLKGITTSEASGVLFNSGFGTETSPYTLVNWRNLANIDSVYGENFYYSLENSLSNSSSDYSTYAGQEANEGKGWKPIALDSSYSGFRGFFNGNGHTISDLYINRTSAGTAGLFGRLTRGTVENLTLNNFNITGDQFTGSLVGDAGSDTHIENVIAQNGTVTGTRNVGGLVGAMWMADFTIENSHVKNTDVKGSYRVGGLAGRVTESRIVNSSVEGGSVKGIFEEGNSDSTGDNIGGLVGELYGTDIENSFANTKVVGDVDVGGLVGEVANSNIKTSYSKVEVSGNSNIGGLVGGTNGGVTLENTYSTGTVTNTGTYAGGLTSGYATIINSYSNAVVTGNGSFGLAQGGNITNSYFDKETNSGDMHDSQYGKTKAEIVSLAKANGWNTNIWSFGRGASVEGYEVAELPYLTDVTRVEDRPNVTTLFNSGFGTEDTPYTLVNWRNLANIDNVYSQEFFYSLENDLSSSTSDYSTYAGQEANEGKGWKPIGQDAYLGRGYSGSFNGNGHTISDLYINRPSARTTGLFGRVTRGRIENLTLNNFDITGDMFTGALVGDASSDTHIENVIAQNGKVTGTKDVGGLIGAMWMAIFTIENSHVKNVDVKGNYRVGGLAGRVTESRILNSSVEGGSVKGVFEEGDNSSTGDNIGGLVGDLHNTSVENSFANTNVSGELNVGGFLGNISGATIKNSYSKGTIKGVKNVGGFVGSLSDSLLENSYATGKITGDSNVGGLIGKISGAAINKSFYDRTVNQEMNDEEEFGKTSSELQDINTFKSGASNDWSIVEDSTIAKGTPILTWQKNGKNYSTTWLIGTKTTETEPTPTSNPDQNRNIQDIITPIVNQTIVEVEPVVINLPTRLNVKPETSGVKVAVTPNKKADKMVTFSELQRGSGEAVRVPVGDNSLITIVDSGVNLPTGLEQQFFVVSDDN